MNHMNLDISEVTSEKIEELIKDLNSIEGIEAGHGIKKSLSFTGLTHLFISFASGVASGLVAHYIVKFFEKEKSESGKQIVINYGNINITQGESKEEIANKFKLMMKQEELRVLDNKSLIDMLCKRLGKCIIVHSEEELDSVIYYFNKRKIIDFLSKQD